ncbi:MFS transporter [candidate division KSB1 bacterium]|nr:MFS transporter [candidate division KSB1 bacterium]
MTETVLEKPQHSREFRIRRILNWLPMGLTYAFLYMARYNLTVSKNALGEMMSKSDFGLIFAAGTFTYAFAFLINGPLTDKIGGKKAILIGAAGSAFANILMGVVIYGILMLNWALNLTLIFSILYACNMYFQSYGAVAIVKVNSSWFHVRERGVFGGIFGILISLGLYFAFDWGEAIVNATKASATQLNFFENLLRSVIGASNTTLDQTWWVFFIPAIILIIFFIIELFLLRNTPANAGYDNFDTGDASSGESDKPFNLKEILIKILTNPIILTIAFIEFCSGVMRNGIMHWYKIFAKDMGYVSDFLINSHWGLFLMLAGVTGGIFAGFLSDKIFGSRRGPVAALLYGLMLLFTLAMVPFVFQSNNEIRKEIKVQISHYLVDKNSEYGAVNLEIVRQKLNEKYQVSDAEISLIKGDTITTYIIKPLPNKDDEMLATKVGELKLVEYEHFNKYQNKNETRQIKINTLGKLIGAPANNTAYILGFIVIFMSLCVIGVHGMLSGTATMDFGGRRGAATAVGLIDGFVYLGTGVQSLALGFLTEKSWNYWPLFLIPFAIIGLVLAVKIWHAFPQATRKGK